MLISGAGACAGRTILEALEARRLLSGTTTTESPYLGAAFAVPGTFMTDNYDNGGEGVAYHDTTATNLGGAYRTNQGVDIGACSDATPPGLTASSPGVGYAVGHVVVGEWDQYTIKVAATGTYAIDVRVASDVSGGGFHFSVDGTTITSTTALPNTGGWQTWKTITINGVNLTAGTHVLRLAFDGSVAYEIGNVEYLQFRTTSTPTPTPAPTPTPTPTETPFLGSPVALPGTILVDNFDNGGEGVAYHDTTAGNQGGSYRLSDSVDIESSTDITPPGETASSKGVGYNVGHIAAGEWLQYTVSVASAGSYDFSVRVASEAGGTFHIAVDGVNVTGSMTLPNTGGWQTWQNVTKTGISLSAGTHIIRLAFDTAVSGEIGNVNYIQVTKSVAASSFTWSPIASSPIPRDEGQTIVVNGKFYAFGGFDDNNYDSSNRSDVYNPATNTWTQLANMPQAVTHAGTIWDGTNIWVIGGFLNGESTAAISNVWLYNVANNTWSAGPSLPTGVAAGAYALVDGSIHVISGLTLNSSGTFANTTEHYVLSLSGGGWTTAAAMPTPRNHLGAVVYNGLIYAIGGQDVKNETSGNQSAVDIYNPATNTWTVGPSLPEGRSHVANAIFVYDNEIYVVAGETNGPTYLADTLVLNPTTDQWSSVASMTLPLAVKAANVGLIGNLLVVFGGQSPNPAAYGWSGTLP
jgi:N-acetylneuraminic acid mutarotase